MSNVVKSALDPADETSPQAPLTPEEFVRELRALRARIPQPDPAAAPAALRSRLAHVSPNFVQASINAAGATPEIQTVIGRTDEELRAEVEAMNRWNTVADESRALVKELLTANMVRRQRIGLAALQTYQVCRQLARDDRNATRLAAHIAEMKRMNRFGRTRRKPAEPVVEQQ
jgi:hypothetical protein